MTKKYRSDALEALHKTAEGLHRAGLVDRKTIRDFDASCLTTVEKLSAKEIADLRKKSGVSQAVFASYLNPNVAKVGGLQSLGAKGAAVVHLLQALGNAGSEVLRLSRRVKKMAYNRPDP